MKKCSVEGCDRKLFGKNFCKQHYPSSLNKKPLLKSRGFTFKKSILISKKKDFLESIDIHKRNEFFKSIWDKRGHYSELSSVPIYGPLSSLYMHHILPKRNYPEAEFDEENIIILTSIEHANVESDIFRYEEINKRRILLKLKYHIL